MTQVINTNVLSLNAQRNLSTSGSSLAQALQRLSSGLRINSAKDDAAGLAIAERFTTQIRGLNQAARNANDGISLAQTGEGALAEITSNLQRIRELAVQSANSTNSASDRAALDQEVQQRLAEIQRVSTQTSFNGQKILDGSFGNAAFQVGANAGETISINLSTSTQTSDVGQIATTNTGDIGSLFGNGLALATGDLTVDGTSVAAGTYTDAATLATAIDTAYQTAGGSGSIASVSNGEIVFSNSTNTPIAFAGTANPLGVSSVAAATVSGAGLQLAAGELTVNGQDVTGTFTTATSLATAIDAAYQAAGGSGSIATANGNEIDFSNATASQITFGGTANPLGITSVAAGTVTDPAGLQLAAGELTINGQDVTGSFTTAASLATAIDAAYQAAGGTGSIATVNGTEIDLTNPDNVAITIGGTANPLGVSTVAASGATLANGDFVIDGVNVTGTFQNVNDLVSFINNDATLSGNNITASNVGGELRISNAKGSDITIAGTFGTTTLGIAATVVDGTSEDSTGAGAAITNASTTGTATTTGVNTAVTDTADITAATGSSTGVAAAVADPGTTTNGTTTSTGVNAAVTAVGSSPLVLATGDLTIQLQGGTAVDLAGSYATGTALADAINAQVAGAFASFDSTSGQLSLSSGTALTIGGARSGAGTGGNGLNFAATSVAVNNGSLASASVSSVANANDTILRVDAALTSIQSLRGALGAIQNRFESTITNLTTASENLTASRSRIQDADFAAETASLTRAQILQQAGTAILAQANAVPQNVLSLLR